MFHTPTIIYSTCTFSHTVSCKDNVINHCHRVRDRLFNFNLFHEDMYKSSNELVCTMNN